VNDPEPRHVGWQILPSRPLTEEQRRKMRDPVANARAAIRLMRSRSEKSFGKNLSGFCGNLRRRRTAALVAECSIDSLTRKAGRGGEMESISMESINIEVPRGSKVRATVSMRDVPLTEILRLASEIEGAKLDMVPDVGTVWINYESSSGVEVTIYGPEMPAIIEDVEMQAAREIAARIETAKNEASQSQAASP
jgi:hypothetical protein